VPSSVSATEERMSRPTRSCHTMFPFSMSSAYRPLSLQPTKHTPSSAMAGVPYTPSENLRDHTRSPLGASATTLPARVAARMPPSGPTAHAA